MSKSSFASLIINKLKAAVGDKGNTYTSSTPLLCQKAIAEGITEYITNNAKVNISYVGTLISGTPDPITSDEMKVQGKCVLTSIPVSYTTWVMSIQESIALGLTVKSPGENNAVVTAFLPFNPTPLALSIPQSKLKEAHENSHKDPTQKVWEAICEEIINWINSQNGCNPSAKSVSASIPGKSAGTASIVSISIS